MTDLIFKELDRDIIFETFDCGDQAINYFLNNLAVLNQEQKLSKTYMFCLKDSINISDKEIPSELIPYLEKLFFIQKLYL